MTYANHNRVPDPGPTFTGTSRPAAPPAAEPWPQTTWRTVTHALDAVPGWAWLALAGVLFAALMVMRWRLGKAHRYTPRRANEQTRKLGGLFAASVAFAGILWAAVLAGSAKNLTGWGRDTLDWRDGWEYLVPATLDGVAIAFAVLMFAAVRANRPANRAFRVVAVATLVSAVIGFSHEYDGTLKSAFAAVYLGFLALGAMAILHELLDLFRSHTASKVVRVNPVFGLRWITYTPNTGCAWLAWQNHPPRPLAADATAEQVAWWGSVRHAVAHLETVRRAKRIRAYQVDRLAGTHPAVGWARVWPWLRVRQLIAALADLRDTTAAAIERMRGQVADAEAAARAAEARADRIADDARRALAEAQAAHRAELAATVDRLTREHQTAVSSLLADLSTARARSARGVGEQKPPPAREHTPSGQTSRSGSSGGQDRSPSSPPWSPKQLRAFELRDADPKRWTWPKLAEEIGVASATVRRWFDHRAQHQATQATTPAALIPIPEPRQPATAGTNGTPVTL